MKAFVFVFAVVVAAPVLGQPAPSQDPGAQLQMMTSQGYVQAADGASTNYRTCLLEHATALRKKNKKVAPDLLIRAAKSNCQKEAGILAMWRSDEVAQHIEDKVLGELLDGK